MTTNEKIIITIWCMLFISLISITLYKDYLWLIQYL
jgi:hypothetical protein